MRKWRAVVKPDEEQRKRNSIRSYATTYYARGLIQKTPCLDCGAQDVQMYHLNFDHPLDVVWYCKACHKKHRDSEPKNIRPYQKHIKPLGLGFTFTDNKKGD